MAGRGGRGEALRRLLEAKEAEEGARSQPVLPPQQVQEVSEVKKSLGRGAIFAKLLGDGEEKRGTSSEPLSMPSQKAGPSFGRGRAFALLSASQSQEDSPEAGKPGVSPPKEKEVTSLTQKLKEVTFEEKPPVIMRGETGTKVPVTCNYIKLKLEPGKGVFEYEVRFNPEVDSRNVRFALLNAHRETIGETKTFDGVTLYLPIQLPDKVTYLKGNLPSDNSPVEIKVTFKRKKFLGETIHLYNVLFRRIMNTLGLALLGRHFFDPNGAMPIPIHKLEVWPGYVTAVDEYEGGIMLCCDASHRVLRTQTVYDLMSDLMQMYSHNWKDEFLKLVIGQSVLTKYNNKLYKVDDVQFECNPMSEFSKRDGQKISYYEYYAKQYNLNIKDPKQPLLISRSKNKVGGKEVIDLVSLIPELAFLTGLTDSLRADMKVMKDIAQCTRIGPQQRQYALRQFIKSVNSNKKARDILESWGLTLEDGTVELEARTLPPEDIFFGKQMVKGTYQADWMNGFRNNSVLSAVDLTDWIVICTRRDDQTVREFIEMMKKCGPQVGMSVGNANKVTIPDDNTEHYINAIRKNLSSSLQIVVIIFPTARNDKYSAVKKLCCAEVGIASQVVQTRTIRRPDKLRSIVQKIVLQMNCKLGGTLWTVKIPVKNTMVCGIDTYHDPTRRGQSYAALVASMNQPLTRWFSKISKQVPGKELMEGLTTSLLEAITKYRQVNLSFPEQILIFRDGVGDGQLGTCRDFECPQFLSCCQFVAPNYTPKILFVVVQKRINTRIFSVDEKGLSNPNPGTIVDHTVTRRDWFDFFLVSQSVRQGTVSPTHYVVVYNSTKMVPDHIQRFSYKLTHLYYNWPGTVRVPAPCQYAHKLAYLVGESIHKEAVEKLADKLYYL